MNKDEMKKIEENECEMIKRLQRALPATETMRFNFDKIDLATYLYDTGCRIIGEDEIVVKKSEYEKTLNEYYEQGKASAFGDIEEQKDVRVLTKEEFYNLKPTLIYDIEAIDKAKKETAREILQELYSTPHEYHEKKIVDLAKAYGIELE